uniref:Zgc:153738 n=1 Tax=Cyprinus carpio TaxID=7962 RepID=A0A8C2F6Z2_CYPCA
MSKTVSGSTYNTLWSEAHEELSCLLDEELPEEPLRPERDRVVFFQRLATFYVRYVQIFRQLEEAYDQSVHPQKRRAIRQVLDSVIGRVLELKNEMVEKEFSEYHYMDDIIQDLKLTPEDLEIPVPRYFIWERNKVLQDRERMFAAIFNQMDVTEKAGKSSRAIKIVQVAERARQGRLRAKFMREIHRDSERQRRAEEQEAVSTDQAAVCIQKVWRGFMQRKITKRLREEEMIFLGMAMDPNLSYPSQTELDTVNIEANRRTRQGEHEDDYQKSIGSVIYQLREVEGPEMKETMKDQIRQWFIECRDATGSFPDYPEEEDGGSALIFVWKNRNEIMNFSQRHELELIKEEKRKEIEVEIRKQVTDVNIHTCSVFKGDYSYLGTTLRQSDIEPMPSLSDVRQVVALYAVLPLGSQAVHEKAPLVKTMLLVGPSGVGKKMLVHAICQETGANLFDLSPLNVAGKYPGKSGLQMMLHVVFKVARLMQPSVIWIGEAEKMFYKKVPKEEKELDPKRLKKDLPKILKSIKGEDCVLIVGTTSDPHSADLKSLCKFYNKIILIPRPDYASRYVMWKELIKKNGGEVTSDLDLSSLAKISDGYTQGHMVQVVRSILTERRIQQFPKRPLTASEFVSPLARIDPVFQEEEEALKNWYAKTPLGKKRIKAALGKDGDEESSKTGSKSGKKKGKK